MSQHSTRPVWFFVHGAWATSWALEPLVPRLKSLGYDSWIEELPHSTGDPSVTTADSVAFVRAALLELINAGREVIPVCYSFGAVIGPSALEGLWAPERKSRGEKGGVIGLVYASAAPVSRAGMTPNDNSQEWDGLTWFGGKGPASIIPGPLLTLNDSSAFYVGLSDPSAAKKQYDPLLKPLAAISHAGELPYVPPTDPFIVPTAFLLSELDVVIPAAVQERAVKKHEGKWARVIRLNAGHLWAIGMPDEAAKELIHFAEAIKEA